MNEDEKRGYNKGYGAGARLAKLQLDADEAGRMREDFIQRMMIAIAPQIIAKPWGKTIDGQFKPDTRADDIMQTVRNVAVSAATNCTFNPSRKVGE